MTTATIESELYEVVSGVLETQAFMFSDRAEASVLDRQVTPCLEAAVRFVGPATGRTGLVMPYALCGELAANILGIDHDVPSSEETEDAIREVVNMICGQFLTRHYGSGVVFNLSIPKVRQCTPPAWSCDGEKGHAVIGLEVDYTPVLALLELKEGKR